MHPLAIAPAHQSFAQKEATERSAARKSTQAQSEPAPDEFELFVKANQQYPAEAAAAGITGEVHIEFTLDRNGRPDLFYLKSSPDPACTTEALRLLRAGPSWKSHGKKMQTVRISCVPHTLKEE